MFKYLIYRKFITENIYCIMKSYIIIYDNIKILEIK